jgi:hypothetical protein
MNEWTSTPRFEESVRQSFGVPAIRPEFVAKVHGELIRRAARTPRKIRFFPALQPAGIVALAVLSLMLLVTLVIGPQRVYAAILQLLGYIPGVGIVDPSHPIRTLAEPVTVTRDGISITVTSAVLTGEGTHIDYRIFGVPSSAYPDREDIHGCFSSNYLLLPDGTRLDQVDRDFPPIPAGVNEAVLVIPCIGETLPGTVPENWELPLRFVPAPPDLTVIPVIESLPSQTALAMADTPTAEVNPLRILKVLDIGDKFVLMGEFSYNAALDPSQPAGSWWAVQRISIVGADGRDVPQAFSNDLDLPTPTRPGSETWLYQIYKNFIPPVTITYAGKIISPVGVKEQAEFEFDAGVNPEVGMAWTVNRDFKLGGYNIRLVSIESSSRGYDFHFKGDPGASANAISVDIDGYSPNCGGGGGGELFPEEFDRTVCYTELPGGPEFPHGKIKIVISFQALERRDKSFQVQWSPDTPFATTTPQSGVCLAADALSGLDPAPAYLAGGTALIYERLDDANHWGLVLYGLDGIRKQVVTSAGNWGALSPDGGRVAYSALDNGIHIFELESQADTLLPGAAGYNLHWSADGTRIAFVGQGNNGESSVFVVNTDGTELRRISDLAYGSLIGFSPDGAQVYFTVPFTGGAAWKVFSFDLAGGAARELFTIENGTPKFLNPQLSLDGNWIAYRGRDNSSLYLTRTDGSGMRLVADNAGVVGIQWTRSGWLGLSVRKADSDESIIVILKPDTCEAYQLPATLHGDLEGIFIP